MTEIVLTEEQKRQLRAGDEVVIRDADGTVWGVLAADPVPPAVLAEWKRRAALPGPRFTTDQLRSDFARLQTARDRLGRPLTPDEVDAALDGAEAGAA